MARDFPKVDVVHIRCLHFFKSSLDVLVLHQLGKFVVDYCAVRLEKCTSRRISGVPKEELLLLANGPVVPLHSLFSQVQILFHLILVGESDPVESLQCVLSRLLLHS